MKSEVIQETGGARAMLKRVAIPHYHTAHRGCKRYHLWYRDMEGHENAHTVRLTVKQANALQHDMETRKRERGQLEDFVLILDEPYTFEEVAQDLQDRFQDEERGVA